MDENRLLSKEEVMSRLIAAAQENVRARSEADPTNPGYYQGFSGGAQAIDITENLTFNAGNAVKYLARAGRVDGRVKGDRIQDLEKAAWYVGREIHRLKNDAAKDE